MGKNCVFFGRAKAFAQNNSQKSDFLGESSGIHFFYNFSSSWSCFFTVLFGLSTTSGGLCEKTDFFRVQKMTFFRVRKNGAFWLQRKAAGFVP